MSSELKQVRVLIVEDEAMIALDIADAVEHAGGEPVGPAATVAEAMALVSGGDVRAAICDVNLPDGDIGPVLEELTRQGVPVVMHTGTGLPAHLHQRFSHVLIFRKPTASSKLAEALGQEITGAGRPADH